MNHKASAARIKPKQQNFCKMANMKKLSKFKLRCTIHSEKENPKAFTTH